MIRFIYLSSHFISAKVSKKTLTAMKWPYGLRINLPPV